MTRPHGKFDFKMLAVEISHRNAENLAGGVKTDRSYLEGGLGHPGFLEFSYTSLATSAISRKLSHDFLK